MSAILISDWISKLALGSANASVELMIPTLIFLVVSRLRLIPARWCAVLAVILLARLLVPVSVPVAWRAPIPSISETTFTTVEFEQGFSDEQTSQPSRPAVLPWIWAFGVAGVLSWLVISHLSIRRTVLEGTPAGARLLKLWSECSANEGMEPPPVTLVGGGLETASVFGWTRPRLLIPTDLADRHSDAELRGILMHELQHLKRHDAFWTWLGLVACAVHWFNPLAWLLFRRFTADRELACDEAALKAVELKERRTYGEALIKTAERFCASSPALLPSFSTHPTELKYRMTLIMKPQNRSLTLHIASVVTLVGISAFAFTTARADGEKPRVSEEGQKKKERAGARDGEGEKTGPRDGEGEKKGPREGEGKKTGMRDGDEEKTGPRDGEGPKKGTRDGEGEKKGPREGEGKKSGMRDGDGANKGERESGERMTPKEVPGQGAAAQQLVIQLDAAGNVINSRGEVIPIDKVRGRMSQFAAENPDQKVILRGDPATSYDKVLKVIDALRDVGLKDVQLQGAQK